MPISSKAAAAVLAASILAACSGGGSVTPQTDGTTASAGKSTAGSRFKAADTTATNDGDFEYNANPPTRPFNASGNVSANALPPPSVCIQVYGLTCYTPAEMRSAYNVPAGYDGSGQTIVIIDAYGSPTIQQDLAYFDRVMGLPDPTLNIMYPAGQPAAFNPATMSGWAGETSLDVEWAHAIAPKATIDLLIAPTNRGSDLAAVEAYAVNNHPGNVVSMSFGAGEPAIPGGVHNLHLQHSDALFQQAATAGITMIASAGDDGATNGNSTLTAQFPASDPSVLSVGGTSLFISDTGAYQRETVWNDSDPAQCPLGCAYGPQAGATGGAPSVIFKAPPYQQSFFHPDSREVADVSYNAGIYTAVLVAESFNSPKQPGLYFVGGTSAGAPQWAGIITLANQAAGHPLGFVNDTLYKAARNGAYSSVFHDVTSGSNGFLGEAAENAGPGYDMPTGLGSPNVANVITALTSNNKSGH